MAAKSKPNEIYICRVYDAPVKAVWDAWTDPKQVAKWWGPRGFSITTISKDLRVGGTWVYTMHGPDGVDWPNITTYYEVEQYARLVYDHGANETQPAMFRVTVTFAEIKGKTKMEMIMAMTDEKTRIQIEKFIKQAGGNSTWDRLAEYLEKESTNKEKFVMNRTFDASINVMFKMWTEPKHFSKWLAPTGFEMNFIRSEIKVGGSTFYFMSNESSKKMFVRAEYKEVNCPDRIVYTQQFCDEKEKVSRHPMAPTWPETMLTTVILSEEEENRTRVTITWEVVGNYTTEELNTFINGRSGMTQGWTGSFDKLEDYLTKQSLLTGLI